MTANEILELVRAGYSKSEIEAMNGTTETPQAETDRGYKELADVVKSLTETVKAMQADNARKASEEVPKTDNAESAIKSFFGDIPKN